MESCWSFQMFRGPPTERLAQVMTMGTRRPAILNRTSLMSMMPWEALAV